MHCIRQHIRLLMHGMHAVSEPAGRRSQITQVKIAVDEEKKER